MAVCNFCLWNPEAIVRWSYDLVIPLVWPSQNTLGSNTKFGAGFKYRKFRRQYEAAIAGHKIKQAKGYRRAYLVRAYGKGCRPYDYANLVGGGKPLVDSLVTAGIILDDSPKLFLASYHQERNLSGCDEIRVQVQEI